MNRVDMFNPTYFSQVNLRVTRQQVLSMLTIFSLMGLATLYFVLDDGDVKTQILIAIVASSITTVLIGCIFYVTVYIGPMEESYPNHV